jgi:hypothetical protein
MLMLLAASDRTREFLTRRLKLDVRGFFRDLDLMRSYGTPVELIEHRYHLGEPIDDALARLPLPDPQLNLREAIQLSRGRTAVHAKFREFIEGIVGAIPQPTRRRS